MSSPIIELSGIYRYINDTTRSFRKKCYDIMTSKDFRALTPLIYIHVNQHEKLNLDMTQSDSNLRKELQTLFT